MRSRRCLSFSVLAIGLGVARPVLAQLTAAGGAFVGYYQPWGHFDPASIYDVQLPTAPADMRGVITGGGAHLSFGTSFGLEGRAGVARSTVPMIFTPGGPRGPTSVEVDVITLEGQYDVSPSPAKYRMWLNAGPTVVRHGGDAYSRYGSPVSVGGAVATELDVPLGRHFHLTADITTLVYLFDVPLPPEARLNPGRLQHGWQRDALLSAGLRWGGL